MAENRKVFRVKDTAGTTEQVFFETKADQTLIDTIDGLTATEVQGALVEIYAQAKKGGVTSVNGKTGAVTIAKADVGLGNVDNTSDANKPVSTAQQTALDKKVNNTITVNGHALSANVTVTKGDVGLGNVTNDAQVKRSEMGVASGVATLGTDGKVPSSQLPSYVDDVLEFANKAGFPTTGETGKIYVAKDTNLTYRWSGTAYVEISASLALGETSSTAYAGDKGKANADNIAGLTQRVSGIESNLQGYAKLTGGNTFFGDQVVRGNITCKNNGAPALTWDTEVKAGNIVAINGLAIGSSSESYGHSIISNANNLYDVYLPNKGGTFAFTDDIPTDLGDLTNNAGYTKNKGTVTSVGITAGTGISVSGSPVTSSGNITVGLANVGTKGTYTAVTTDEKGRVTAGGRATEWGTSGQTTPSADLMVGGLFFALKA